MAINDHLPAKNPVSTQIGLTILRVFLGAMLVIQGSQKLLAGPQGFIGYVQSLGAPVPELAGWLVMLGEFGLGIALILGVFTRVAAGLVALMMFLIWLATAAGQPLFTEAPGITAGLLWFYFAAALALLFSGGGSLAVERLFGRKKTAPAERIPDPQPTVTV
ncbi:DoxX family protein [Arthrobacter russicus]